MDQDGDNVDQILDFKPWFDRRPFKYVKTVSGKARNVGSSVKNKVKNVGSNVKGRIKRRFGRDEFQEYGNTVYSAAEKVTQVAIDHNPKNIYSDGVKMSANSDGSYDVEYAELNQVNKKEEKSDTQQEDEGPKDFYALQVVEKK